MARIFQIVVFGCAALMLTACSGPEESLPIWEQVKITDIVPSQSGKRPGSQSLKTINLNVYIFEVPAENISALENIRQMLYTNPLQFEDYDAFGANLFTVGFGQVPMWNKVGDLLRAAEAKRIKKVSLLLPDGQTSDFAIARLDNKQTIFHITTNGSMKGMTIGPGTLTLRIKAEKIPGSRGLCRVDTLPVFTPLTRSSIPQLAAREKTGELLFTSCRFELKMSPGDFIFLSPQRYTSHRTTLGGLFFSRAKRKPTVRAYLIVCTRISD